MAARTFDQLYRGVPTERREMLRAFRASHPYQHATINGVAWEYIASGAGQQALLILGGGAAVGESAFSTITRLEKRFRVISPTYPALGQVGPLVKGLVEIIRREGFERAHVFGHSLGAGVGHVMVRQYPEQVDKLVLDAFGLYSPSHTQQVRLFTMMPFWLVKFYYRNVFRRLLSGAEPGERAFMTAYINELLSQVLTQQMMTNQFNLLLDIFDNAQAYGTFRPVTRPGRVLLMLAEDDRGFTAEEQDAFKATYPDAQLHIFANGGHIAGFSHPQEYTQALDEFLT